MNTLSPSIGPAKWRRGVAARFLFNAQRCRRIARGLTDPEERAYTLNLAELWNQLAEAAQFKHELGSDVARIAVRPKYQPARPALK